jgi:hypothetical protein
MMMYKCASVPYQRDVMGVVLKMEVYVEGGQGVGLGVHVADPSVLEEGAPIVVLWGQGVDLSARVGLVLAILEEGLQEVLENLFLGEGQGVDLLTQNEELGVGPSSLDEHQHGQAQGEDVEEVRVGGLSGTE